MSCRVLLLDNYDSFTFNLFQGLRMLGAEVVVRRNDEIDVDCAVRMNPTHLIVSPGPGRPERAGKSMAVIRALMTRVPVLGVCLGHQAVAGVSGAKVGSAMQLMHGKTSAVYHDGRTLYEGLPNPFQAGRYHSLAVVEDSLPDELAVSAYTSDGEIMGLRHRSLPVEGVQFHPESVLTPEGQRLLRNFLDLDPAPSGTPALKREEDALSGGDTP
jgi:anthranilate synthase/aminodeoxychorismate synthase-like glutamine amidotransferase